MNDDDYDHDDEQTPATATTTKAKKQESKLAEKLITEAANARKALTTPRGTKLRLDLLGELLNGHAEESHSVSEPCPVCRANRNIRIKATNELKPDTSIEHHDRVYPGEYTYSPTGLSMTPRTERVKTHRITGYSRKVIQTCDCGAPRGWAWHYAPEAHGLTLVQVYHRF